MLFLNIVQYLISERVPKWSTFVQTWECDVSECAKNLAVNHSLPLERDLAANLTARY